jgi:type IV pilus assembly protein PilO
MKNIPFWGQLLIVLLVCAAVVFFGYKFWLSEDFHRIGELQKQLDDKNAQIQRENDIVAKLPQLEAEIARLRQTLADLKEILPTEPESGELLKWIKNLADQSNLDLKDFSPESLRAVEFYKEYPIHMSITGAYHDMGLFLDRVSKYSRIINVSNVNIVNNPGGGDKTIRSDFVATTFIYDEAADKADKAAAAGGM